LELLLKDIINNQQLLQNIIAKISQIFLSVPIISEIEFLLILMCPCKDRNSAENMVLRVAE